MSIPDKGNGDARGKGGNEGTPDKEPPGGSGASSDEINKAFQAIQAMATAYQELKKDISSLKETISSGEPSGGKGQPGDDEGDDGNVEFLSNTQLLSKMEARTRAILEEIVRPLKEQVEGVSHNISSKNVADQVAAARSKHKDFNDWLHEIKTVAEEMPGITAEDAYVVAKARNPEKAKELDQKYNPPKDKDKEGDPLSKLFGGFEPNSKGTGSKDGEGKMDLRNALEQSFDEILAEE